MVCINILVSWERGRGRGGWGEMAQAHNLSDNLTAIYTPPGGQQLVTHTPYLSPCGVRVCGCMCVCVCCKSCMAIGWLPIQARADGLTLSRRGREGEAEDITTSPPLV